MVLTSSRIMSKEKIQAGAYLLLRRKEHEDHKAKTVG